MKKKNTECCCCWECAIQLPLAFALGKAHLPPTCFSCSFSHHSIMVFDKYWQLGPPPIMIPSSILQCSRVHHQQWFLQSFCSVVIQTQSFAVWWYRGNRNQSSEFLLQSNSRHRYGGCPPLSFASSSIPKVGFSRAHKLHSATEP